MPFESSAWIRCIAFAGTAVLLMAGPAWAGTLVYTPTNPTFGGNPLNGSTLLSLAQIQNQHQPSSGSSSGSSAPLTQGQIFAQQLTSQLYASLANSITQAIFGSSAAPSGTFSFAGTTITYVNDGTNVKLTINDGTTSTTITLPATAISH